MQQIPLQFPVETSYRDEDFLVSDCNREAWQAVRQWAGDDAPVFLLRGEQASGRTHLAGIWAMQAQAAVLEASALRPDVDPAAYFTRSEALLLENIDRLTEERALFHLLNAMRQHPKKLLLTVAEEACWGGFSLPDLRTRLQALPQAIIGRPDDELIAALLVKHFQDRQLDISHELVAYLVKRMDRSFAAIAKVVERLDHMSASQKKPISIAFARQILTEC